MMARRSTKILLLLVTAVASLGCDSGGNVNVPPPTEGAEPTTVLQTTMRLEFLPALDVIELDPIIARVNGRELRRSTVEANVGRVSSRAPQRREDVFRRLVDELLIDDWLDEHAPIRPEQLAVRDAKVVAMFGDEASFARHCGDANLSEDAVRADLLRAVRLRTALAPQPSDDAVSTLYTTVTRRPARETIYDLFSVRPAVAAVPPDPSTLCADATSLRTFQSIRGKHVHLGEVASRALAPTLAEGLARGERCVPVTTAAGTQLYFANEVQQIPTEPYARVAPQLREHEMTRMIAAQRAELLQKLRAEATIELFEE